MFHDVMVKWDRQVRSKTSVLLEENAALFRENAENGCGNLHNSRCFSLTELIIAVYDAAPILGARLP